MWFSVALESIRKEKINLHSLSPQSALIGVGAHAGHFVQFLHQQAPELFTIVIDQCRTIPFDPWTRYFSSDSSGSGLSSDCLAKTLFSIVMNAHKSSESFLEFKKIIDDNALQKKSLLCFLDIQSAPLELNRLFLEWLKQWNWEIPPLMMVNFEDKNQCTQEFLQCLNHSLRAPKQFQGNLLLLSEKNWQLTHAPYVSMKRNGPFIGSLSEQILSEWRLLESFAPEMLTHLRNAPSPYRLSYSRTFSLPLNGSEETSDQKFWHDGVGDEKHLVAAVETFGVLVIHVPHDSLKPLPPSSLSLLMENLQKRFPKLHLISCTLPSPIAYPYPLLSLWVSGLPLPQMLSL